MEQKAELQHENRDSITVKRNAKGEYAWDLKAYYDSESGNADVLQRLQETDTELRKRFLEA